jgi:hypothetical protein
VVVDQKVALNLVSVWRLVLQSRWDAELILSCEPHPFQPYLTATGDYFGIELPGTMYD